MTSSDEGHINVKFNWTSSKCKGRSSAGAQAKLANSNCL